MPAGPARIEQHTRGPLHRRDRKGQGGGKGQGDRKGRPYYTPNRLALPVYSRGGACPRPGTSPTLPQIRANGGPLADATVRDIAVSSVNCSPLCPYSTRLAS